MKFSELKTIAFVVDWPESSAYHRALLRGAHRQACQENVNLLVIGSGNFSIDFQQDVSNSVPYEFTASEKIDGIILVTELLLKGKNLSYFQEKILRWGKIPIVSIGGEFENLSSIRIRQNQEYRDLMHHLFGHHRYINPVIVTGPNTSSDSIDRKKIVLDVASEYGISIDDESIFTGRFNIMDGELAYQYFWEEKKLSPDVAICLNDGMAIGLMKSLRSRNINVPEDVAVVGYDDIQFSFRCELPLTTIRQPLEEQGMIAIKTICDRFRGQEKSYQLETSLVVRSSCGCAREDQNKVVKKDLFEDEVIDLILDETLRSFVAGALSDLQHLYHSHGTIVSHKDFESRLLSFLGTDRFYLTYSGDASRNLDKPTQLFIAWENGQKIDLPSEGLEFRAIEILPNGFANDSRWTMLLLHMRDNKEYFGTLILEYNENLGSRYIEVATYFSSSLSLMRKNKQIKSISDQLIQANLKLRNLSSSDELTGLLNRRGFMSHSRKLISLCKRNATGYVVLFIDLDGLKRINDQFGHEIGDLAIKTFATLLRSALRDADVVSRFGGDEFCVFMPDSTVEVVPILRDRLQEIVDEWNSSARSSWKIAFSLGAFSSEPKMCVPLEILMQEADKQLYLEKRKKKAL